MLYFDPNLALLIAPNYYCLMKTTSKEKALGTLVSLCWSRSAVAATHFSFSIEGMCFPTQSSGNLSGWFVNLKTTGNA